MHKANPIRLAIVITNPQGLDVFFRQQVQTLQSCGVEVHAISGDGPDLLGFEEATGIRVRRVSIQRRISPLADLIATYRIWQAVREIRPDVVHAHTPKSGLLGMVAAVAAGVKVRYFTFHGLRTETLAGWRGALVRTTDRLTATLATHVLAVSPSLRNTVTNAGICPSDKVRIIGNGACSGLDPVEFDPERRGAEDRRQFRRTYQIPEDALVLGFAGRFSRDKGISELRAAWEQLSTRHANLWLFLCGFEDVDDPVNANDLQYLYCHPRVRVSGGLLRDMPAAYAAMDILALPTYREGFGVVAMEAGAMRLPVVASRVDGVVDAVEDGVTGLLVKPRDAEELAVAIDQLVCNANLRKSLGSAARSFVVRRFRRDEISCGLLREYRAAVEACHRRPGILYRGVKRGFDVLSASLLALLTAPIFLLAAIAVRYKLGTNVIFRQERGGLGGKTFRTYKLRTMSDARDDFGNPLPDPQRMSAFGRFLRKTSIDELPQLWNVIKGDMSLVGPRPLLARYVGRYNEFQRKRLVVRPGITGWAQIHGRNLVSWDERFRLDVWYVEHANAVLDLRILAATALQVVRPHGVNAAGDAPMTEFLGSPSQI